MNALTAFFVLIAALSADAIIEVAAEISAEVLLDADAGATASLVPGKPMDIVDMAPRVSLHWPKLTSATR